MQPHVLLVWRTKPATDNHALNVGVVSVDYLVSDFNILWVIHFSFIVCCEAAHYWHQGRATALAWASCKALESHSQE